MTLPVPLAMTCNLFVKSLEIIHHRAEAPTRAETRKNTLINKGISGLSSLDTKAKGMKKVRSYDVLKPDEFSK